MELQWYYCNVLATLFLVFFVISKEVNDTLVNVSREEHMAVVNKAWDICQEVVASYMI